MMRERNSERAFFGTSALFFATSVGLTATWSTSMSSVGGMRMPGGWTMSMTWLRMPGQTWLGAEAWFVGMWVAMMAAMMLPSLMPALCRYRQRIGGISEGRVNPLTTMVAMGYFFVWTMCGVAVFPLGAALAKIEMQEPTVARFVPFAVAAVVLIAGALQFTTWKSDHLGCFRGASETERRFAEDGDTAWGYGLRLGLHCMYGCAGFTAILLVIGVMDLRVMSLVTAAISAERLAPNGERVARMVGIVVVGVGLLLIARASAGLA